MRQAQESGILVNATELREELRAEVPTIQLHTKGYNDIFKMGGDKLEDGLRWAYRQYGARKHDHHLPPPTATPTSTTNSSGGPCSMPRRRLRAATT